jgi:hypothetical protein
MFSAAKVVYNQMFYLKDEFEKIVEQLSNLERDSQDFHQFVKERSNINSERMTVRKVP